MVHLSADIECWGCERMFSTFSGMIIHLERGSCPSGINAKDLNKSAAMCYQWSHFIYDQYRICLLSREHDDSCSCTPYPFKCPDCDTGFPHLSALFQHVGTRSCDQELDEGAIGKLVHWLKNRHAWLGYLEIPTMYFSIIHLFMLPKRSGCRTVASIE